MFQSLSYNFFLLIPLICKIKKQNIPTHKRYIWSEFVDISLIFYTVSLLTKKELIVKRTCKSRMVYLKHVLSLKKVFVDVYAQNLFSGTVYFHRKRSVKNNNTFIVSLSLLNIAADFTNLSFILV